MNLLQWLVLLLTFAGLGAIIGWTVRSIVCERRHDEPAVPPGRCGNQAPAVFRDHSPAPTCDLRAGHAGWHEDGGGTSWTHRPDTEAEVRADLAQVHAILSKLVIIPGATTADLAEAAVKDLAAGGRLTMDNIRMRPVYEAAVAWAAAGKWGPAVNRTWDQIQVAMDKTDVALLDAVDEAAARIAEVNR